MKNIHSKSIENLILLKSLRYIINIATLEEFQVFESTTKY